jgi:hypothetical protein
LEKTTLFNTSSSGKETQKESNFRFLDKRDSKVTGAKKEPEQKNKRHSRGYREQTLARGCLFAQKSGV